MKAIKITEKDGTVHFENVIVPENETNKWKFICNWVDENYPSAVEWE